MTPPSLARRVVIVALYIAMFWVLLPAALWTAAQGMEPWLGRAAPAPLAALLFLLTGGWLLLGGMLELWRGGGGLPITALPPPRFTRHGPYRHVRHPIYLGFNLLVVGAGLAVGSPALAWVLGTAVAPLWMIYALVEERGLRRRFGRDYSRFQRQVGLLPRLPVWWLVRTVLRLGWPLRVEHPERVPRHGAAVLVANHACYLDPLFLACVTRRTVRFVATAEAYRHPLGARIMAAAQTIPIRRYAPEVSTLREILRTLQDGELVGFFIEGERSALGDLLPLQPDAAGFLARSGCPVIPVGICGSYDAGPRWADEIRRRPVTLRVGEQAEFDGAAAPALHAALRALLQENIPRVSVSAPARNKIHRVLWRCPVCLDEPNWDPAALRCAACGLTITPTADGLFACGEGAPVTLAALAHKLWAAPEPGPLTLRVQAWRERSRLGPIAPLERAGAGALLVSHDGIALRDIGLKIARADMVSVTTERADTLQIATAGEMWQFRAETGSVFRAQRLLVAKTAADWRGARCRGQRWPV
ncbi:MAG: 1-acyl-sn-glycerol-3-phosphate acyltransferase [Deltaproteobacteria bacterium]|nr:1-acyl-sn-glycerol-3-phosphate acyltransferase [Deltaproteobacteria bacterium]